MVKEIKVYFCPECKSTDVKYVFSIGNLYGMIPTQECMVCNVRATTFPILVTTQETLDKRNKEKEVKSKKKKSVKKASAARSTPKALNKGAKKTAKKRVKKANGGNK